MTYNQIKRGADYLDWMCPEIVYIKNMDNISKEQFKTAVGNYNLLRTKLLSMSAKQFTLENTNIICDSRTNAYYSSVNIVDYELPMYRELLKSDCRIPLAVIPLTISQLENQIRLAMTEIITNSGTITAIDIFSHLLLSDNIIIKACNCRLTATQYLLQHQASMNAVFLTNFPTDQYTLDLNAAIGRVTAITLAIVKTYI